MLILPRALSALFIAELIARAKGQTTCAPLMQALVQQAEATNGYGSWDACCARTGIDCYLSRVVVAPGYEPCDAAHSARAGCNRVPQGTVCMIGNDGQVSGSPCGVSKIRTCASVVALGNGVANHFEPPSGATAANIIATAVLESQLCCSSSACTFGPSCTSQYNMNACVSDGTNFICIPLDQPDDTTYAAHIVQDGNNCKVTSSTGSSSPASTTTTAGGAQDAANNNGGGNTAIIGGSVGGAVGFLCIAALSTVLYVRSHAQNRGPTTGNAQSNEWPGHQGTAAMSHVPSSPNLPSLQSTSGRTPSFSAHPDPQWTSPIGTFTPTSHVPLSPNRPSTSGFTPSFPSHPDPQSTGPLGTFTATSHVPLSPNRPSPQSTSGFTPSFPSHPDPQSTGPLGTFTATSHAPLSPSPQSTSGFTPSFPSHPGPQWTSAIGTLPSFPGPSLQNQNAFEFPANPQNPSQEDPQANVFTRTSHQSQNTLDSPPNPYQYPGASNISHPAFQPSVSPSPPFHKTDFPSSAIDTQAMEARIAELENQIVVLSGPSSGVQVGGSGRGGAVVPEEDPPGYNDKE